MANVTYRHPTAEDFFGIAALVRSSLDDLFKQHGLWDTAPFASARLPPIPPNGPFPMYDLGMKEDYDGLWVAEVDGEIAGFGYSWVRGQLWYLAQLFVLPKYQGLGIGRSLMSRTLEHGKRSDITIRALTTFAYNPVSISLYSLYGIYPRTPMFFMEGASEQIPNLKTSSGLKSVRVEKFDEHRETINWIDENCIGYPREKSHELFISQPSNRCYIFSVRNEPVGYSYVNDAGRVGPIALTSTKWFLDTVKISLVYAAEQRKPTVNITVNGSNNDLMKLALDYGMKIRENVLFMSSKPFANFDTSYVMFPTGAFL